MFFQAMMLSVVVGVFGFMVMFRIVDFISAREKPLIPSRWAILYNPGHWSSVERWLYYLFMRRGG
jgi:hypothetical protein